ncbi:MAG: S8 family serine peptidase [Desulfobacterales bacterium]|nr:S8 family serine peptidase [Desulfobacterales bacterium]
MKRFVFALLIICLSTSICHATDLWQDVQTRNIFDIKRIVNLRNIRYDTATIYLRIDEVKRTTVNLDRTLFGRARNHNSVDIANQVKNAWSQGYTGQGVSIGILDYMGAGAPSSRLTLRGVNSASSRSYDFDITVRYQSRRQPWRRSERRHHFSFDRSNSNNGNFSGHYKHWERGAFIIGGRHQDADGTVLYGIAKDAHLSFFDANNRNRVTQLTSRRLDFINASFSTTAPTNRMTNLYKAMNATNTYEDGKLPVFITSGGNVHRRYGTASYQGIAQGERFIADYNAVDMAMSDETIDGRPLSDYLLIAGGFSNMGNGVYRNLVNRPGEVVELQNRWLSAPYTFYHDAGALHGTSYAAPYITGIAGIVKSKFPELAPADVANILLETARDIGAPGTDAEFGRGLVDLGNALSPQ